MAKDIIEPVGSFEDFLGQTVRVGDHVVYATVSGRSPVQKFAVVEKIENVRSWDRFTESHELKSRFRVGVRELSNGRGFARYDAYDWKTHTKNAKPARVTYPMRQNIVRVRSAAEVELAEHPAREVLGRG